MSGTGVSPHVMLKLRQFKQRKCKPIIFIGN